MRSRFQPLTRGNTVLAGMLLISLLSAGALALDSFSMQRNPYGLTAAVTATQSVTGGSGPTIPASVQTQQAGVDATASTPSQQAGSQTACEPGMKYQIRVNDGKGEIRCEQRYYCAQSGAGCKPFDQLSSSSNGATRTNQCIGADPGLIRSPVEYCIRKELSRNGEERCTFIKYCEPGNPINPDDIKKQNEPRLIREELLNATPEQKTKILNTIKADSGLQEYFDDAYAETQSQVDQSQEAVERLETERNAAQQLWQMSCGGTLGERGFECAESKQHFDEVDSALAAEKARLAKLQQDSLRLRETQAQLQPGTVPGTQPDLCRQGDPGCYGPPPPPTDLCTQGTPGCYGPPAPSDTFSQTCAQNPYQAHCRNNSGVSERSRLEQACLAGNQSACQQIARGGAGGPPGGSQGGLQPRAAGPQQPQRCSTFSSMIGSCQEYPKPTCMISAQPSSLPAPVSSVTDGSNQQNQPPRNVTLTWQTQNAISAYLSSTGPVGPSGSMVVQPTGATTYTMTVTGPQNQQGQCSVHVGVGGQGSQGGGQGETGNPTAQISCEPKIADVGMKIAISYACQNAATAGASGFDTGGKLSGSTEATIEQPTLGVTSSIFGLTCSREGRTHSAQCAVQINKPTIVLVANPSKIHSGGDTAIGWVTAGMESCTISSPTLAIFTAEHEANKSTSGVAKTPQLAGETEFVLTCTTKAGGTHTAKTIVEIDVNATSWLGSLISRFSS